MKVEVINGEIEVLSLNLTHNAEDVKVIEVDTLGGYYDLETASVSDTDRGSWEEIKLIPHGSGKVSKIRLYSSDSDKKWMMMVGGQYKNSFSIVLTDLYNRGHDFIWEKHGEM